MIITAGREDQQQQQVNELSHDGFAIVAHGRRSLNRHAGTAPIGDNPFRNRRDSPANPHGAKAGTKKTNAAYADAIVGAFALPGEYGDLFGDCRLGRR